MRTKDAEQLIGDLREALRIERLAHAGIQRRLADYVESFKTLESERDAALAEVRRLAHEVPACARLHLERRRLPDERPAATKTFRINGKDDGVSAHVHCGEREDGSPAELFVRLGSCHDRSRPHDQVDWYGLARRLGYLARTMCDAWATAVSLGLQYGVPLEVYLDKHAHQQDVPGYTNDPAFPRVNGLLDYMARWLKRHYSKQRNEDGEAP